MFAAILDCHLHHLKVTLFCSIPASRLGLIIYVLSQPLQHLKMATSCCPCCCVAGPKTSILPGPLQRLKISSLCSMLQVPSSQRHRCSLNHYNSSICPPAAAQKRWSLTSIFCAISTMGGFPKDALAVNPFPPIAKGTVPRVDEVGVVAHINLLSTKPFTRCGSLLQFSQVVGQCVLPRYRHVSKKIEPFDIPRNCLQGIQSAALLPPSRSLISR